MPLAAFLTEEIVPYDTDEVTRLILDSHDAAAFAVISHLTVGDFRDWLLETITKPMGRKSSRKSPGAYAGDGRGGEQADAQSRPHRGRCRGA
ncbi:ethanolamine ammonia-lyase large subunit domain protein [Mycobacteroides abscessus]|nr:ethanolamine ammonia-lyase large subunit domain protein [Mycobacteroides abscessus]